MNALTLPPPAQGIDMASISWALLLASITAACLWILRRFPRIAEMGPAARAVAHVAIGYFGCGMLAFGAWSAARQVLPVPGGLAWEGSIAVIGGLAACVIGGTTLIEHAHQIAVMRRVPRLALVPAQDQPTTR